MGPVEADVIIVGGGAAGLATAIVTARRNPRGSVVVVDAGRRPGAKILLSGGGRCNVTNAVVTPADYRGGSPNVIRRVLRAFPVDRTVEFFRQIGVTLHEETGGKLFPDTHRADTVLDALLGEVKRLGVRLLSNARVIHLERRADRFAVSTSTGHLFAPKVVLATGGLSAPETGCDGSGYRLAKQLGHAIVPTTPALVPLVLDGDFHKPLSGIAHDAEWTVRIEGTKPIRLRGSMLWTHFGVSGPVVLDASRFWHRARLEQRAVTISVNFLGGADFGTAQGRLIDLACTRPKVLLRNALSSLVPSRIGQAVLRALGIDPAGPVGQLTRGDRSRLAHALIEWSLPVRDSRGYAHAEVTAGGVSLSEINPATMASRKCPGLYLVGEVLDVDGRVGGFNLQWAWSSAWVAGVATAPPS